MVAAVTMSSYPPARLLASDGTAYIVTVPVGPLPPTVILFRGRCFGWRRPAFRGGGPSHPLWTMLYREVSSLTLTEGALVRTEEDL